MRTAIIIIVVVILLVIFGPQILYTVDETQLAVVTQFGEVRAIHTTPGLKVKTPFIQSVNRFDRRVLRIDMPPQELNDVDKFILVIDAYTRYRITDVRKFFEKLRNQGTADGRIGSIIASNLKEEVAQRNREEIIGAQNVETEDGSRITIATNTRQEILERVRAAANREVGPARKYLPVESAESIGIEVAEDQIIETEGKRLILIDADLAAEVEGRVAVETIGEDLGVEIIDVRMKRADFSTDIQENIFRRMRTERERISNQLKAEGAEAAAEIVAVARRDRDIILAEAEKDAEITRGEGEAQAVVIFASALELDPEFYAFQRSLQAYRKFLTSNATVVLSSEADLFQFLQDPDGLPDPEESP